MNTYQTIFEAQNGSHLFAKFELREQLAKQYAWAVPNDEAIKAIVGCGPVVEIGAGKGYWAHLVAEAGGDVVAYDLNQHASNHYTDEGATYHPVKSGSHHMVKHHADRVLMLIWPCYDEAWAAETLNMYGGDTLIYVGEGSGGCTGDDYFHEILREKWEEVEWVRIPQWGGIHDYLGIYKRKT